VGLGPRQVQKCLKELETNHLIERRQAQGGRHKSSVFVFLWSAAYETKTLNDRSPFSTGKGEQKFAVPDPERVNDRSRNGELSFAERVNDRSPRINSIEVIHEESSERASHSEDSDPPPARLTDSYEKQTNASPPGAGAKAKEPQAEGRNCLDPVSPDVPPVVEALEVCGIKIPGKGIAAQLLNLAAEQDVGPPGLIAFIQHKAKTRRVEIATFFQKAIPQDIRSWAARNGWLRSQQVLREPVRGYTVESTPFCTVCGDTGQIQTGGDKGAISSPDGFCDCVAGESCREVSKLVYSVSRRPCPKCLSTLRVQTVCAATRGGFAECAFCEPGLDFSRSERPSGAAARLAVPGPAEKCEVCEWDRYAGRNTGIVKVDWLTERSSASYCACRWGEYARSVNQPDYLDRISQTERDIARREREWSQATRGQQLVLRPSIFPRVAAPSVEAVEPNRIKCPDCGMEPGEGFHVEVESGIRIMEPCACTAPELAAGMRKAAERVRQHHRIEPEEELRPISAMAERGSPTLARAIA
jgi:hypothetical protein